MEASCDDAPPQHSLLPHRANADNPRVEHEQPPLDGHKGVPTDPAAKYWRRILALVLFGTAGIFLIVAAASAVVYLQGRTLPAQALGPPFFARLHGANQHQLVLLTVVCAAVAVALLSGSALAWSRVPGHGPTAPPPIVPVGSEGQR